MKYVYILKSKQNTELYIGCTSNLQKRLILHNAKKVKSTKSMSPLTLIHYEAFINPKDAFERERYLKTGWGRNFIKKNLFHYFND